MINVGVTQHHRINAAGIKWEWFAISGFIHVSALDQAAVKQQTLLTHRYQVTGTCHFTGCTKKLNAYGHNTFLRSVACVLRYQAYSGKKQVNIM